jgi:hypothetical protein
LQRGLALLADKMTGRGLAPLADKMTGRGLAPLADKMTADQAKTVIAVFLAAWQEIIQVVVSAFQVIGVCPNETKGVGIHQN